MKKTAAALSLALLSAAAVATPINSNVSCAANTCTIAPDSGNVALDNTNFSLELDWGPQFLELAEPADDRGEWRLTYFFELTGTVTGSDSFETVPVPGNDFVDHDGNPILALQYDDVNLDDATKVLRINFEIFGPDTLSTFLAFGLNLAPSSFIALNGTTIDSFEFRDARLSTLSGTATTGIKSTPVPEPAGLGLLALGFAAVGLMRRRSAA